MLDSREARAMRVVLGTAKRHKGTRGRTDADSAVSHMNSEDRQAQTEALAGLIAQCFAALAKSFPYDKVKELLDRDEKNDTRKRDASDSEPSEEELSSLLSQWVDDNMELWESALAAALFAAAMAGFHAAFNELMAQFKLKGNAVPEMTAQLERWAKECASKLFARLKSFLTAFIGRLVKRLLNKGLSSEEILKIIKARLTRFFNSEKFPEAIAGDEESKAWNEGAAAAHKLLGTTAKRWFTRRDSHVCAICGRNGDEGEIPIGQPFSSGHFHPPAHCFCRCTMAFSGATRESVLGTLQDG